ncbi:Receptor-like protein [Drosera capensis]
MEVKCSITFLLISVVMWICLVFHCYDGNSGLSSFKCMQAEREALLRFKGSLADLRHSLSSWKGNDCCIWKGVGCDNTTGHVIKLDLQNNRLVSSELDSALLDLKHLVYLDLSGNDFRRSRIPEFIGSMKRLEHLGLSRSHLSGLVPHQLGNLTSLSFLQIGNNALLVDNLDWLTRLSNLHFLGLRSMNLSRMDNLIHVLNQLPSLSRLHLGYCGLDKRLLKSGQVNSTMFTSLQYLDLEGNSFGGLVPKILQNFSSLRVLDLSANNFNHVEGGIWSFIRRAQGIKKLYMLNNILSGELSEQHSNSSTCISHQLEELDLSFNELDGHVPAEIGRQLPSLRRLVLDENNLNGTIPFSTQQLLFLELLSLSSNNISGEIPPLPSSLETIYVSRNSISGSIPPFQSNLLFIDLSYNNISGSIPPFHSNPQFIDLSHNNINGYIPDFPSGLLYIDLSYNRISGRIPHFTTGLEAMDLSDNLISGPILQYTFLAATSLRLANNLLNGTIPEELCRAKQMYSLDLGGNRLSGMIPNCWNINLQVLSLSSNQLTGPIPSSFLQDSNLEFLDLSNNTLQGEIPYFAVSPHMQVLDLGGNKLSGTIQFAGMLDHRYLQVLRLRENYLEGQLPSAICSLRSLRILDLADNNLTGNIPPCLGNFTYIFHFDDDEVLPTSEVLKGDVLEYTETPPFLANVDLSVNNLVGGIPDALVKFPGLVGLNLSYNHLTGSIPNKIGEMTSLESLDLSNNHLSGTIPQSMSDLSSLSYLNLSYNNLQGEIPTGSQLQTLIDPSIYTGNQGLCGDSLPKKCKGGDSQPKLPASTTSTEEHEDDYEKLWFYLVIAAGFTAGFWGVVGTLVMKKSWRYAYFKLVEDLFARICVQVAITKNKLKEKITNHKSDG